MSKSAKSLKVQLRTVGRFPKFFALFGVSSLVLPFFSYGATAATVRPSVELASHLHVVNNARTGRATNSFNISAKTFASKLGSNGVVRISTHYSALLDPRLTRGSVTTTVVVTSPTTSTTVVAPPATTVVPPTTPVTTNTVASTSAQSTPGPSAPLPTSSSTPTVGAPAVPTTTVAPTTTTTVAPTTTTTVAPTTTTTVAPSSTATTSGAVEPVASVPGPWHLAFDSEFSGTTLNTTKWSTGWFGSGITNGVNSLNQACMDPAQVSVSGGALNLTAITKTETCAGVTQPYASGMVTTNGLFDFTYGYMEARVWLPGTGGVADWPAFWTIGPTWPASGEIDVMEGMGGLVSAHLHNGNSSTGPLTMGGTFTGGWHTFACDWEPGSLTFYYDGTNIGSFTSGVPSVQQYLILDLALSSTITSPNTTPATMKVDYVRVWQH